jgi:predicted ester cyclase
MFRAAFPDLHGTIEDQIAEGDKVVSRMTYRGTHQGELMGIPPTGKQVTMSFIGIHRITAGKVAEGWVNFDALGMMQQLGVIPSPERA